MVSLYEPRVIFEDDELLVVDKPGGLVCHSAQRPELTSLADWTRARGLATPRMINRLDRETSGLVLLAKTARAARIVGKQTLRREIEKTYVAIVHGTVAEESGVIEEPIGMATGSAIYTRRAVDPVAGVAAVTEYAVRERLGGSFHGSHGRAPASVGATFLSRPGRADRDRAESDETRSPANVAPTTTGEPRSSASVASTTSSELTVVELTPRTGRTHQLRVHLSHRGHPIVGDKIYGPDERWYLDFIAHGVTPAALAALGLPRHALHAGAVRLTHPTTGERVTFAAPLPADLEQFIASQR